jgi:hypothetical protein
MSTPMSILGDCVSCRTRDIYLFRWKPELWRERGWHVWVCQECRCLPPDELRERIEWNVDTKPILPGEQLILKTARPTTEDLAEMRAVAEAARAILNLLAREEAEPDGAPTKPRPRWRRLRRGHK